MNPGTLAICSNSKPPSFIRQKPKLHYDSIEIRAINRHSASLLNTHYPADYKIACYCTVVHLYYSLFFFTAYELWSGRIKRELSRESDPGSV